MVGWMSYWSHRSETGVRSRRWSRRMAAFSWALGRFRVFLGMGEPPLEIVAYSSGPFFPFRLKQNNRRVDARTRDALADPFGVLDALPLANVIGNQSGFP